MADRKPLPGKFVWYELLSPDHKKAQPFYAELVGWRIVPFPMGTGSYDMIYVGEEMLGGFAEPRPDNRASRWVGVVSVDDVDAAARATAEGGGKIAEAPADAEGIGRLARIVDPQGGELSLIKSVGGDPPDVTAWPPGHFIWNELHTPDAAAAVSFYGKVVGFASRAIDMGPSGTYHILSRGGAERGGVTSHMPAGLPAMWLPYVAVADCDGTLSRAERLGGQVLMGPHDIPGIGRFGVVRDPVGAQIAVMKSASLQDK